MSPATNSHECIVEVGGLPISLRTDDPHFLESVRQRYAGFISQSKPQAELLLELATAASASDEDVQVLRDGREWLVKRGDFRARWDPQTGRGTVRQNPSPYALDSVLRIVHSLILASTGGFLLHAASAICEDKAYVFSGVSGAGKTTMTRLAPENVVLLTDEVSYIRPAGEGYSAFGTPFAGELARVGENCSAPIAALFFLNQGPENRVDELPTTIAVQRLMRNILFFAQDRDLVETIFASACQFVSRIPVRQLTFYPDSRVWNEVVSFGREAAHA